MKTFPAAVVSRVTQIPITRLQQYFDRNHITMQPCDIPSKGSGEKRGYSRRRINQIAITTQLGWLGIGPSRAAQAGFQFSDKGNPGREVGELFPLGRTLLVGARSRENKVINVPPYETLEDVLKHDAVAFVVDCGKIMKEIQERMDKN